MKTVQQLRNDLASIFDELRSGAVKREDASELANLAGKMISSAKVQVEYYAMLKETPNIKFLNTEPDEARD